MITLTPKEWREIKDRLMVDYPPSYTLLRANMKNKLGFTTRTHSRYVAAKPVDYDSWQLSEDHDAEQSKGYYVTDVCLDFYNEAQETFFRMKYL